MPQPSAYLLIAIGCAAGIISGLIGIGGGIIIVPALIFIAGFSQLTATGTSIAILLLPIGLGAAIQYYRAGHVDVRATIIIAATFFIAAWASALFSKKIDPLVLKIFFGTITILVGIYIIINALRPIK